MAPTELEQALIDSVAAEIKLWVEEMPPLKTGYDYETRFTERMHWRPKQLDKGIISPQNSWFYCNKLSSQKVSPPVFLGCVHK